MATKTKKEVKKSSKTTKTSVKKENVKKYAVVRFGIRQYLVEEGKEVLVDKLTDAKKVEPEVLLSVDGEKVSVGKPVLKNAKIKIKVISELEKGKKVRVFKYKAKSRYRKTIGFRPQHTRLLVEKIV